MKKSYFPLVLLVASALVFGCRGQEAPKKKEVVIRPVRYAKVYAEGGDRVRTFSGVSPG